MTVLFWDIDGTLLTTAKGGVFAWDDAVKEITGRDFQLASMRIPGMTDYQIAVRTLESLGLPAGGEMLERLVRRYEELLPTSLPRKIGRVLPNVRPILESLADRDDVRSYLLTGNTRGGARAKLTHYHLWSFFPDGAFAEDANERSTIAHRAMMLARQAGPVTAADAFVIGDTPHDIECANAIGVRTIAVATGGYSLDELRPHEPWRLFDELPAVEDFVRLIETAPRSPVEPAPGMKRGIRRVPALWRATRLARRWYHARRNAYPDWRPLLAAEPATWAAARAAATGGPRVLMASSIGSYAHAITLESALAAALTFRGAEVHALLCDAALSACAECEASLYPNLDAFVASGPSQDLCRDCTWPAERVYRQLGLRVHRYSDWLKPEDRTEARRIAAGIPAGAIPSHMHDGVAVGEHAYAGALRFFATGSLDGEPRGEAVLRRYLESAMLTAAVTRRLCREVGFSSAVFTHGIYVPWGIVSDAARREGVRVSTWNVAYRKRRFIFSHDDTYHHTLMTEPREHWEHLELTPAQDRELMQYLASRREGLFDWIVFHRPRRDDPQALARTLGLDPAKPAIGLLTNVSWDAQLHYPANAFPNMLEWLVCTCEYFATRPDLQLLVRVHPAEISGFPPSRQPVLAELARRIPRLSPNIFVVGPENPMSTYALMSLCNAAIIYGTKMGVELTSVGQPVVVAGEAWIRNKGLTHDASSREEYLRILDRLPFAHGLESEQLARARRYAYHFFFNRMIPLPFIEPKAGYPIFRLKLERLAQLQPGQSPGLDTLAEGVLSSKPFVLSDHSAPQRGAPVTP